MRQACAGRDIHSVKAFFFHQLINGKGASDDGIGLDVHAHLFQPFNFVLHDFFGQTELGNAVHQHAAGCMQDFKDGYVIAFLRQHAGTGQAGGSGTYNGNLFAVFSGNFRRIHFVQSVFPCIIRNKALQAPNCYRFAFDTQHAAAFTLFFLRADTAADSRQAAFFFNDFNGGSKVPFGNRMDKFRNVNINRAAFYATGLGTVQAAFGFFNGSGFIIAQRHFFKIATANLSRLFRHSVTIYFKHLQAPPHPHSTDS